MTQQTKTTQIPVSSIILDEAIYPRKGIDHRRVSMFSDNIRDGIVFDPVEVQPCPDRPGFYRLLDGAHRWTWTSRYSACTALASPRTGLQRDWVWPVHHSNTICRKWQCCQIRQMPIYV